MKPFVFTSRPRSPFLSDSLRLCLLFYKFCCGQFAQKDTAYCMHTTTYAATGNKITLSNELPRARKYAMQKVNIHKNIFLVYEPSNLAFDAHFSIPGHKSARVCTGKNHHGTVFISNMKTLAKN